jgi:ribonuclease Z
LQITFLGTSSGVPTRSRNVSSVAVKLSQRSEVWLLDCGEGTQHQILRSDLRVSQIRRIFITHMHGDHIFGLMGLLASCGLAGNPEKIDLYGPPGLEDYLQACRRYSQTHLSYPIQVHTVKPGCIFSDEEYEVYCDRLEHRVTAYGYRIQEKDKPGRFDVEKAKQMGIPSGPLYGKLKRGETVELPNGQILDGTEFCGAPQAGQTLAYCTDTVLCDSAIRLAYHVDVLIHESTYAYQDTTMAHDRLHSTATMAAQVAQSAAVKQLFLTHFSPRYAPGNSIQLEDLLNEAQAIFQKTALAHDFLTYEIPR